MLCELQESPEPRAQSGKSGRQSQMRPGERLSEPGPHALIRAGNVRLVLLCMPNVAEHRGGERLTPGLEPAEPIHVDLLPAKLDSQRPLYRRLEGGSFGDHLCGGYNEPPRCVGLPKRRIRVHAPASLPVADGPKKPLALAIHF